MTCAAAIRPKHQAQPSKQAKPQTRNGGQPHAHAFSMPLEAGCRQNGGSSLIYLHVTVKVVIVCWIGSVIQEGILTA